MSAVRIGKIKLKAGGEVRLLRQDTSDPGGENWRGELIKSARKVASYDEAGSRLAGFFVLGLYSDRTYSMGYRFDQRTSPIPRRLMPAYVEEIIRTDLLTKPIANDEAVEVYNHQRL